MNWSSPLKPAELTENRLIDAVLEGHFPIGSHLPPERELAAQLGVTRPTLREALQRLARDGWLDIQHGKPTRVRDYWQEGNLGVLSALARRPEQLPDDFIINLLQIRLLMAPTYTRMAVYSNSKQVLDTLDGHEQLPETPSAFASFDWQLHHNLTLASSNPIFTLILNGFKDLYLPMAEYYFQRKQARANSSHFYAELTKAAAHSDPIAAETITRSVMHDSIRLWQMSERAEKLKSTG